MHTWISLGERELERLLPVGWGWVGTEMGDQMGSGERKGRQGRGKDFERVEGNLGMVWKPTEGETFKILKGDPNKVL